MRLPYFFKNISLAFLISRDFLKRICFTFFQEEAATVSGKQRFSLNSRMSRRQETPDVDKVTEKQSSKRGADAG